MNLNNFDELIDPVIVERGYEYYCDDNIVSCKQVRTGKWVAKVLGSKLYKVEIKLNNQDIIGASCNCPFDGYECKHIVAVLFYLQNEILQHEGKQNNENDSNKKTIQTVEEKIENILKNLTREELEKIIIDRALKKEDFLNFILAYYDKEQKGVEYYKKLINTSLRAAMDRHGFIDYYHADKSVEVVFDLLEKADDLVYAGQNEKVIPICKAIIDEIVPACEFMDDSNGHITTIMTEAIEILNHIATNLSGELSDDLFEYCLKKCDKNIYMAYGWWRDILAVAIKLSTNKKRNEMLLQKVDELIQKEIEKNNPHLFRLEELIVKKYELLNQMNLKDEALQFLIQNLSYPKLRELALEIEYLNENYDEVIRIANDGVKNDSQYNGLVKKWKEWLLMVYIKTQNKDMISKVAFELCCETNDGDKYYKEYKAAFDKETWPQAYSSLKQELYKKGNISFSKVLANILVMEEEYNELLEYIKKFPRRVTEYQRWLLVYNPQEVYNMYVYNIAEEANKANSRNHYQNVCRLIVQLAQIGGKNEAKKLMQDFSKQYNKRKAFLEELSKIRL